MASVFDYPAMLFRLLFVAKKDITVCIKEAGLVMTIPKKFHLLSVKQVARLVKRKEGETEMILQKKLNYPSRYLLFFVKHEVINKMVCTYANFDELRETEWKNQNDDIYNNMLKLYYYRYKDYKHVSISTENGARQKDNIIFNTTDIIAATPAKEIYRTRLYSTVYKNYGIFITMTFADEKTGEEMLNVLRSASFK